MKCLYPREIVIKRNEKTKDLKANKIYVPCRICAACQRSKRYSDCQRVMMEAKSWKYKLMITLTYDNKYIRLYDYTYEMREGIYKGRVPQSQWMYYAKVQIKASNYIRNFKLENTKPEERALYYYLVDEFTTLQYNDIKKYLDTVRKSVSRDRKLKDKRYMYFGCGEYPSVKENRGRPHYHILFMFNDKDIVKHFISKWNYGNTTVDRGDNQIDARVLSSFYTMTRRLNTKDKLKMIITLDNKDEDIERILNYIKNENIDMRLNSCYEVLYIAAYTNKKQSYDFMNELNKQRETRDKYWYIVDLYKNSMFEEFKKFQRYFRHNELLARRLGDIPRKKEEPFIFKSKNLGRKYVKDNLEYLKDNILITVNGRDKLFKEFYQSKVMCGKYIRDRVVAELTKQNRLREVDEYIKLKNSIVASLRRKEIHDNSYIVENVDYEIMEYEDGTIDIYDIHNDKNSYNIRVAKEILREQRELTESRKNALFGKDKKLIKSEIFKDELNSETIRRYLNDKHEHIKMQAIETMINDNSMVKNIERHVSNPLNPPAFGGVSSIK